MVHKDPVKIKVEVESRAVAGGQLKRNQKIADVIETIETTPEHPFYVTYQGFVNAEGLKAYMKLGSV